MSLWSDSFAINDSCIADEFLQRLIRMYRARAKFYQILSWVLLGATAILIAAGIIVFIQGDAAAPALAESEVSLHDKLHGIQQQLDALANASATTEEELSTSRRTVARGHPFPREKRLVALRTQRTPELADSLLRTMHVSKDIISQILRTESPVRVDIVVSDLEPGDSNSFPVAAVTKVRAAGVASSLDFGLLAKQVNELVQELELLKAKTPAADSGMYSQTDMATFILAVANADQLLKLDALSTQLSDTVSRLQGQSEKMKEEQTKRESQRQALEKDKADADQELVKVREQREKILFMSWIPGLTIRVGTVVLLLFLTQVLLATYRYTLGVSGFYLARGDAIQLVRSEPDNPKAYKLPELAVLAHILTPSRYQIDPVKDPSDHFTDLAKAWIAKK